MNLKSLAFIVIILSLHRGGRCVTDVMDRALRYLEPLYGLLETEVVEIRKKLEDTTTAAVLSGAEAVDRHASHAAIKLRALREDCRVPAEVSLEYLSARLKEDFRNCTDETIAKYYQSFLAKCDTVMSNIQTSSNLTLTAVKECLENGYESLIDFKFEPLTGWCKLDVGAKATQRFLGDSTSVKDLAVEAASLSYRSVQLITECFKDNVAQTSIDAVIEAAEKCQGRLEKTMQH